MKRNYMSTHMSILIKKSNYLGKNNYDTSTFFIIVKDVEAIKGSLTQVKIGMNNLQS